MSSSSAATPLQADDFICTRDNIMRLLQQGSFYAECAAFAPLHRIVWQLAQLINDMKTNKDCSSCASTKVRRGQAQVLDNFARLFLHYHDAGKLEQLQQLRTFIAKERPVGRLVLAYSGPATKGKNRIVFVE